MNFYHSFWEFGHNKMNSNLYDMHKLSALTCLKNHGNIHLITTQQGKEFLKDIPYTSVELFNEEIDKTYSNFWAISKIYAYRQIARKMNPFIHIDYDVFLFKKLPDYILESRVCTQEMERMFMTKYESINKLKQFLNNKYLFEDYSPIFEYNTGIFGGNDTQSILLYCEEVLKLVFDDTNFQAFNQKLFSDKWHLSTILEQSYLSMVMQKHHIDVAVLFNDTNEYGKSLEIGYTHLMGAKKNPKVIEAIKKKILEYQ